MQRGKKWRGKKEQQQEQGSEGNKTHRDRKRTESLRGGPVFRKAELLETEKLKPAKVAGAFGGKRKKKKICTELPGEQNSLTASWVKMWAGGEKSCDTLAPERRAGCRRTQGTVGQGACSIHLQGGASAGGHSSETRCSLRFHPGLPLFHSTASIKFCICRKMLFPDIWISQVSCFMRSV